MLYDEPMASPLIATKLYVPLPRPQVVHRPHLIERLDEGVSRKLTLVSAPAGFGKTTLVSQWIADSEHPAGWLSLDEGDSDPVRFLMYVIAALQTVATRIGEVALSALQRPQPPPIESILTVLLNEITTLPGTIVLVLEDYHLIDATSVDHAIAFLIEHLPSQLHLLITTREDPQLPLARLRARGQMTELRASDLRFTAEEAAAFLREVMGLELSSRNVAELETRTEGWIAGLQLAALSMQGREDIPAFIRAFAGDDRYIVDYLVDEVLEREPDHIRNFLLQTSILDRLSGALCDAVTGRNDSRKLLESLDRANLFVMPLDTKRQWYRYHHLFGAVLRAHALEEEPEQVTSRHRAASEWFERNGSPSDAIWHALAARDFVRAAGLIEDSALRMLGSSQEVTLWSWLEAIPDELVRTMPVLSVYYGFTSFSLAGFDAAEARFRDAERWLDEAGNDQADRMIVVNETAFRSLPGTIAVGRAYRAGALGDVDGIVRYARQALDVMPADDDLWGGAASTVLGIGYWTMGDLEPAYRSFVNGRTRLEKAGYMQFQIVGVHILADIRVTQGHLREAERIYQQALQLATEHGEPAWGTVDLYVGLSELCCQRGDLEAATRYLLKSKELGDHAGLLDTRHRWYIAMAGIEEAEGNLDAALDLLDEAARQYVPGADPDLRPIAALKAQLWVAQERIDDALHWARERDLSVDDQLSYLREFEHLTLARVLIANYRRQRDDDTMTGVLGLLDRLLDAAEAGERTGSVIAILVLQALAHEARSDISAALASLERALTLAEPEGYVQVFVGEGPTLAPLLSKARASGLMLDYTGRLLGAFEPEASTDEGTPPHAGYADAQSLADSLSEREREVLLLIAEGLSNRRISERLFLALDTVKGHNRRIFGKLGVQSRTEAIARARELGLL
jgi:LuxR family transcriptional regulator, maltose regulon positive regulatory protein